MSPSSFSLHRHLAGIAAPDTVLAREAAELAFRASSPMLFNHVMRSYYLGRLIAAPQNSGHDDEVVFLSTVLHDLGLTDQARGHRRFELEGADAARAFLMKRKVDPARTWLVWDTIALHTWQDINLYKEPEARIAQLGIVADVLGFGLESLDEADVQAVLQAYPRLGFKTDFLNLLRKEAEEKPDSHVVHPVHMVAQHCCYDVPIPDAAAMIQAAPYSD